MVLAAQPARQVAQVLMLSGASNLSAVSAVYHLQGAAGRQHEVQKGDMDALWRTCRTVSLIRIRAIPWGILLCSLAPALLQAMSNAAQHNMMPDATNACKKPCNSPFAIWVGLGVWATAQGQNHS